MSKFDTVKKNLEAKGYTVKEFATAVEAGKYLDTQIDNCVVGFGGSATTNASGAYDLLAKHNEVHWHWKSDDVTAERMASMQADVYLTSVNAITQDGVMVSLDGAGNRVAGMLYGHKKVYYLIGTNKIVEDLPAAYERAWKYCAPIRAKQLNRKTPCAVDGVCHNCNSPDRVCNGMCILLHPMMGMPAEVLLINEELGI